MIIPFGYFQQRAETAFAGFVFSVKTDNVGKTTDTQFELLVDGNFTNDFIVDWGDGNTNTVTTSVITHTYAVAGTYDISISGTYPTFEMTGYSVNDRLKVIDIKQWGNIAWSSFSESFYGCENLNISATDVPDLSGVTDLYRMFRNCTSLTSFNPNWDTSTITNMDETFSNCTNLDVSFGTWDLSSVTILDDFLIGGKLSTANYDSTLIGWEAQAPPLSLVTNFGTSRYTEDSPASIAKASLLNTYLWTITDGGAISKVPLANIISEYKFENNVLDFVGSNDGTATAITYEIGLVGQAISFNSGNTAQVEIVSPSGLSFGNGSTDVPFSVSFLFNLTVNATGVVFNKKDTTTGAVNEYRVYYTDGRFYVNLFDDNLSNGITINSTTSPIIGTWQHITITYDGSGLNTGIEIYADGLLKAASRSSAGSYVAMNNTGVPLVFGKNSFNTGNDLEAELDCLTFWNKELTDGEVERLALDELNGIDINP